MLINRSSVSRLPLLRTLAIKAERSVVVVIAHFIRKCQSTVSLARDYNLGGSS